MTLSTATKEQKIRELAKIDGWVLANTTDRFGNQYYRRVDDVSESGSEWRKAGKLPIAAPPLPPYLTSHDAILPVVRKQTKLIKAAMLGLLNNKAEDSDDWIDMAIRASFDSTAEQIADALLIAKGVFEI